MSFGFNVRVLAWGEANAGYDEEADACASALACCAEHGLRVEVEDDRDRTLYTYEPANARAENVRDEVKHLVARAVAGRPVTLAEHRAFHGNSWEHEAIVPALDDEALCAHVEHCAANCFPSRRRPCVSYPDALAGELVPELLRRIRDRQPK